MDLLVRSRNRESTFLVGVLILVFGLLTASPNVLANTASRPHVLVINSYTPNFPTTEPLLAAIREELSPLDPVLEVEYLASKAAWSDEYAAASLGLLRERLSFRDPYDLIIATDDHALDLVRLDDGTTLDGPVVAVGINGPEQFENIDRSRVTGAIETIDVLGTLVLARTLQQDLQRVVLVTDGSQSGNKHEAMALRLLANESTKVEQLSLATLGLTGVQQKLSELSTSDAVLILSAHLNQSTEVPFSLMHRRLCEAGPAACYSPFTFALDAGVVGGSVIDMRDHGHIAGKIARQILGGDEPSAIDIVHGTPTRLLVVREAIEQRPEFAARLPAQAKIFELPTVGAAAPKENGFVTIGVLSALILGIGLSFYYAHKQRKLARGRAASLVAERNLASVGRMTAGMVHDLNNLLLVVQWYGESIEQQQDASASIREDASIISAAGQRAVRLTKRVKDWAQGGTGIAELLLVNEHIRELATVLRAMLKADIDLHVDADPDALTVCLPPVDLDQMVLNLVANAGDASSKVIELSVSAIRTQEPSKLLTGTVPSGHWVVVEVRDDGNGIDPEILDRAAEDFFSTKAESGTGIGLSTVRKLCDDAGGAFDLKGIDAGGTTAQLWLPADVSEKAQQLREHRKKKIESKRGNARVWVVDDDNAIRRVMKRNLERFGYQVTTWATPTAALSAAVQHVPQLLIMDLGLPGMSGVECAAACYEKYGHIPTIYISGSTSIISDPPSDVVEKPFDTDDLLTVIHQRLLPK